MRHKRREEGGGEGGNNAVFLLDEMGRFLNRLSRRTRDVFSMRRIRLFTFNSFKWCFRQAVNLKHGHLTSRHACRKDGETQALE